MKNSLSPAPYFSGWGIKLKGNKMSIIAVRDNIVLKVFYLHKIGDSPIYLPDAHGLKQNVMDYYGEVISVGPDCRFAPGEEVRPGDKVLFPRNEGHPVKSGNWQGYISLSQKWIDGRVE